MMVYNKRENKLLNILNTKNGIITYYSESRNINIYYTISITETVGNKLNIIASYTIRRNYLDEEEAKKLVLRKAIEYYGTDTN